MAISRLPVGVSHPQICGGPLQNYPLNFAGHPWYSRAPTHSRPLLRRGRDCVGDVYLYRFRCRSRPCADLGRCAPSVRLGTPSELGARSSLLATLAPTRLPPRSDGGFPSPPLRDGALRRPRLGRRLATAPPRGSAALGPASVGLGRAGEGYEHSARLARSSLRCGLGIRAASTRDLSGTAEIPLRALQSASERLSPRGGTPGRVRLR